MYHFVFSSILEFVYLGSVNIDTADMEEFKRVMEDLQISTDFKNGKKEDTNNLNFFKATSEFDSGQYNLPKNIIIREQSDESEEEYKEPEEVKNGKCLAEGSYLEHEHLFNNEEKDKASDTQKQVEVLSMVSTKQRKHYKSRYLCDTCDFKTNLSSVLKQHQLFKHGERTFLCHMCDKKFFNGCHLKEHIEAVHEDPKDCSICYFKASTKRNLDKHISKKHFNQTPLMCTECSYTTTENSYLKSHIGRLHTDKETWRKCTECDYRSWNKRTLIDHHMKVHQGLRLNCEVCPSKFTKKRNLNAHIKKIHKDILKETTKYLPSNASFSERYYFDA